MPHPPVPPPDPTHPPPIKEPPPSILIPRQDPPPPPVVDPSRRRSNGVGSRAVLRAGSASQSCMSRFRRQHAYAARSALSFVAVRHLRISEEPLNVFPRCPQ
jgi:hypothetical protein